MIVCDCRMVLTLVMCFLCKAAGAAVLQPGSWRFKSLRFAMSLDKAVCLQSLNPLKTSFCISGPIFHISVYCSRILIWEIGRLHFVRPDSEKHLRLTNKQTDGPKDNKACGQSTWWSDSEPEAHIWSLCPLSLSRKTLRECRSSWVIVEYWTVVEASIFK